MATVQEVTGNILRRAHDDQQFAGCWTGTSAG